MPSKIAGLGDVNWAASLVTRKVVAHTWCWERHPIFAGSTTKAVISLSSGDRDFNAAVRGACRTLGLAALVLDICFSMQDELRADSAATKGRSGQVRHIHCPAFWLQQALARRKHRIEKQIGSTPSANVRTKAGIPAQKIRELLTRFGCHTSAERADVALEKTCNDAVA